MKKDQWIVLSLLAAVMGALLCGVAGYLLPNFPIIWELSGVIGVIGLASYLTLQREVVRKVLAKKTTRYGINSVVMSVIVFFIVLVINLIVKEHDIKKDVTKNKLHTLSDQSIKILRGLKSEIRLRAFVYPQQIAEFDHIFDKYTYYTKLLKKEYVDLDKEPYAVDKYKIKQAGTIIVESDTRSSRVENIFTPDDPKLEEKLTNAIIQVAKGDKKKIYFISGHGERLYSDTGRDGFSEIKEQLEGGRYQVEDLPLVQKDHVPNDADMIVCAAPKSDFMEHELKMLEGYLKTGGKALFLMEPTSTPTLRPFLAKFGADWKYKKTVLETNRLQQLAGGNPLAPIVNSYDGSHDITKEMKAQQLTIFPVATPIEKTQNPPKDYRVTSLFSTTNRSLEVDYQEKIRVDEKRDRHGPISLALAISGKADPARPALDVKKDLPSNKAKDVKEEKPDKENEFRLVVVGNAAFASNGVKKFAMNGDLFQNILSWLSKEEDMIAIRPRPTDTSDFEITEERNRVIFFASVLFAPFSMFLSGILVWMARKKK